MLFLFSQEWRKGLYFDFMQLNSNVLPARDYDLEILLGQCYAYLSFKRGEIVWADVNAWRLALHHEFDDAFASTKLPERPDYERVNAFLIHARREQVRDDKTSRENDA